MTVVVSPVSGLCLLFAPFVVTLRDFTAQLAAVSKVPSYVKSTSVQPVASLSFVPMLMAQLLSTADQQPDVSVTPEGNFRSVHSSLCVKILIEVSTGPDQSGNSQLSARGKTSVPTLRPTGSR